MPAVHDVSVVRAAEAAAISEVGADELMQRAATGLAATCAVLLQGTGGVYGARVVALVGSGNNGGDALFAASRLAGRGAQVIALTTASRHHAAGAHALTRVGGRLIPADHPDAYELVSDADLVIDGIVGIGGHGGLTGPGGALAAAAALAPAIVVAVDVPSGVDADTGEVVGQAISADVTVTFGCLKPGLTVMPGVLRAGVVETVDIGLGPWLPDPLAIVPDAWDIAAMLPARTAWDHKYTRGVVGVCAGSVHYPGAAVLAVAGAVGVGPGMVRYSGPCAADVVRAWPGTVPTAVLPSATRRTDAWAVGPGLGQDPDATQRLADVLGVPVPVVIDADALSLIAADLALLQHVRDRKAPTVLTPHAGEAVRLVPGVAVGRPLAAARELAVTTGATVLLKGYRTVVAEPGESGRVRINPTGTPALAVAGSGDVLTGAIAAFLALGLDPCDAAAVAAYLHGLAGRQAAEEGAGTALDIAARLAPALRVVEQVSVPD